MMEGDEGKPMIYSCIIFKELYKHSHIVKIKISCTYSTVATLVLISLSTSPHTVKLYIGAEHLVLLNDTDKYTSPEFRSHTSSGTHGKKCIHN